MNGANIVFVLCKPFELSLLLADKVEPTQVKLLPSAPALTKIITRLEMFARNNALPFYGRKNVRNIDLWMYL